MRQLPRRKICVEGVGDSLRETTHVFGILVVVRTVSFLIMASVTRTLSVGPSILPIARVIVVPQRFKRIFARDGRGFFHEPDTRKYEEPQFDQKVLLAACEPILPADRRPSWEQCKLPEFREMMTQEDCHPLEKIWARQLKEEMAKTRFIAFYHTNPMSDLDFKLRHNALFHRGYKLHRKNRMVYELAIKDTKFECLHPYIGRPGCSYTAMAISFQDKYSIKEILTIDKKLHGLTLLFAFVEDRLVRKDQLIALADLPSLDVMRAQVSATLNHALSSINSTLQYHPSMLAASLQQVVERDSKKEQQQPPPTKSDVNGEGDASSKEAA